MSCFINKNLTGGVDNVASLLAEELKSIFPDHVDPRTKESIYYQDVLREGGSFKNAFGVDWESKSGQKYIAQNYPGFLGEQGEPKLYVDKLGRAYFKTPNGKHILNPSVVSENERYEAVKAMMAQYVTESSESLNTFIVKTASKNIGLANSISRNLRKKKSEAEELFRVPGISQEEKNRINYEISVIGRDIRKMKNNVSFLESVFRNESLQDIVMHDIKMALESSKIAYSDDIQERENDNASASMELGHLKPSNESNPQNSMPTEILQLISTIPKTELKFDEEGSISGHEKIASELMPSLTYIHDYSDVFKEVQKVLNNVVADRVTLDANDVKKMSATQLKNARIAMKRTSTYEAMIENLEKYEQESNSHIVSELLTRIKKLVESQEDEQNKNNIKSKFVKSFHKAKSSNVMHTASPGIMRLEGPLKDKPMINLNKVDVSNEEKRAELLAAEMLISSFMKLNSTLSNKEAGAIDAAYLKIINSNSYHSTKNALGQYLSLRYGMKLQDKTVSQLMNHINKNVVGKEKRRPAEEFLKDLDEMNGLMYNTSSTIVEGKAKAGGYSLKNLAKDYIKMSQEEQETVVDNFVSNGGNPTPFGIIAALEYRNSPSSADSSIAVGSKKVWLYSFMSKLQKDVIRWKSGDIQQLKDLEHTGNGLVDYLLGSMDNGQTYDAELGQKRIDKINLKNNMELRNKMDSDPTMFDKLTREDLIMMAYANLYENKKEKYEERAQGGAARTGKNQDLREMIDNKDTAGEMLYLNNADKTQTLSFSGVLRGNSAVSINEDGVIESIGKANIDRLLGMFRGELNKIKKTSKSINKYNNIKTKEAKLAFAMKNFVPGWHYATSKVQVGAKENGDPIMGNKDYTVADSVITKDEFMGGNNRKFGFMNGFYMENKDAINKFFFDRNGEVFESFRDLSKQDIDVEGLIDSYFTSIVQAEAGELADMEGKSERQVYSEEAEQMITLPSEGLFEMQTSVIHEGQEINPLQAAANFSMDYFFHSMDLFSLSNGEIGMYKQKGELFNVNDAFKRTPAMNADGIYPATHNPLETAAYIPFGSNKPVTYLKQVKTIFAAISIQEYEESHYGPLMQKMLDDTNDAGNKLKLAGEVSDGQSYGNPNFLIDIYERTYGLSKKQKDLHTELMDPKTVPTQEHFSFLKELGGSNQASKLMAFSMIRKDDGTIVPFFWKSSVIPLYPSFTSGFPIDKLREQMESQGVNVVGNVSAFKTISHTSTDIFEKSEGNQLGEMKMNFELNPFEVETEDIKIQVELSAKGDKEAVAGTQNLRNLVANMDLDSEEKVYRYEGKDITAKQMLAAYDTNIKNIIQFQLDEFLEKIGYSPGQEFDQTMFRRMISDQLTDLDYDIKHILEDVLMPLETIPGMSNRIFPIIAGHIHKQVSKPKTLGTAAIQVANTGFNFKKGGSFDKLTKEQKRNSIIFGDSMELKPPRPRSYNDHIEKLSKAENAEEMIADFEQSIEDYNANAKKSARFDRNESPLYFKENQISLTKQPGFHAQIEDGEIMIPFSSIFKKSGMSWEEFQAFVTKKDENGNDVFDKELLNNIIGYRIPNQSMSSNDSFKVVGVLHPSVGDSAILYHEITAKTGSDFDIDKMVLMLPYFKTKMRTMKDGELSEDNLKVIKDAINENKIQDLMLTNKYFTMADVFETLAKNDNLNQHLEKNGFWSMSVTNQVDYMIENKDEVEGFVEKDNRKATFYRRTQYSVKEVMKDFYSAQEEQAKVIDANLKEAGFQPRKRYVAESFSYINDPSEKGLQNKLISSMKSILKSSVTYDDLISPLDGTHIKDSINEVRYLYSLAQKEDYNEKVAEFNKKDQDKKNKIVATFIKGEAKSLSAMMMPNYLTKSRTDMLMAKGLTATMANHMTNIPITQIQKIFMKYDIGLESSTLSKTHVIGKEKLDVFKITKMVSYLMNASVDAAKDNYIIEGNYNSYTSGAAMLMVRLGIDPKEVSKILMHPAIIQLSKQKLGSTSKIADIKASYTNSELDEMAKVLALKLNPTDKNVAPMKIFAEDFVANVASKSNESESKLTDEDVLGFWHMAVTMGKDLNDAIKLSKPDSNGFGKTASEAHALSNLYDLAESNTFAGVDENGKMIHGGMIFGENISGIKPFDANNPTVYNEDGSWKSGIKGTNIAAIANVAVSLTNELTNKILIERTPGFIKLVNQVMINIGLGYSTKEKQIKRISATLYPYVLATSGHPIYQFASATDDEISDMEDLLSVLPMDILKLKSSDNYSDNKFLKEINVDQAKGFISFNNAANYSDLTKIAIKDSANTLYSTEENREIMERLAKYCFLTTGFKPSSYSFVNYLAKEYFVDSDHAGSMSDLLVKLNDSDSYVDSNLENALLFLAANKPDDETIFKKLKGMTATIPSGIPLASENMLKKVMYIDPDTKAEKFYPFVSIAKKEMTLNYALTEVIKMKNGLAPIYNRINVMQYVSKNDFEERQANADASKDSYDSSDEEAESGDENGQLEFNESEKRTSTKRARSSRMMLFNTTMSNGENVFQVPDGKKLVYEKNSANVLIKNAQNLFNLAPSKEANAASNSKQAELKGADGSDKITSEAPEATVRDVTSNKEMAERLKAFVEHNIELEEEDDREYIRGIINDFYQIDKNAHYKQKAMNALGQVKKCN